MAKTIEFNWKGTDYTLEYTRKTVKQMQANGFDIKEIDTKATLVVPELFAGSFLAHHRGIKQEDINAIFNQIVDKYGLTTKLIEMYNEPIAAMMADPEESESNLTWKASF